MKDTYLSIDLDYWNYSRPQTAEKFFQRLLDYKFQIFVVESHEYLLSDIQTVPKNVQTLVNLDFHDDFAVPETKENGYIILAKQCAESEWVRKISWREKGTYIWRLPSYNLCIDRGFGLCDGGLAANDSPNAKLSKSWWLSVRAKQGAFIDFTRVGRVGISVSPEYLDFGRLGNVPQMLLEYPKARFRRKAKKILRMMAKGEEVELMRKLFKFGAYAI